MVKAIGLLSGGLDSTLAVRLILEQSVKVFAISFVTPFCTCTKQGCQNQAKKVSDEFGVELKIIGLGEDYIRVIKNPKYGYGKNMNPCIDCRILMFSKAREYMGEIGASFIFTGEVLGQRPMSQHLKAMGIIEKESRLEGRILRPLCAKLLKLTIPEIEGMVDRSKLLALCGRSRKSQISLAHAKGITEYPCPAGGCRLTDPNFARRLQEAFEHGETSLADVVLLRYGRHFRLPNGTKVIIGRNEIENTFLKQHSNSNLTLELTSFAGPVVLLNSSADEENIRLAAGLCVAFSDYRGIEPVNVSVQGREILASPLVKEIIDQFRIK